MKRARLRPVAALPLVALALAGCRAEETNGVDRLSADEVVSTALDATRAAGSFHLSGEVKEFGVDKAKLDLSVRSDGSAATGTVELPGKGSADVIRVGETVYVKGPRAVLTALGATTAPKVEAWVSEDLDGVAELARYLDLDRLTTFSGQPRAGQLTSANGSQVVAVVYEEGGVSQGVLYARATGTPVITKLEMGGDDSDLTVDRYGELVSPIVPQVASPSPSARRGSAR